MCAPSSLLRRSPAQRRILAVSLRGDCSLHRRDTSGCRGKIFLLFLEVNVCPTLTGRGVRRLRGDADRHGEPLPKCKLFSPAGSTFPRAAASQLSIGGRREGSRQAGGPGGLGQSAGCGRARSRGCGSLGFVRR